MTFDHQIFIRLGMPPEQAAALTEMIENRDRAPDIFTLNVKAGINLSLAHELCGQIVGGAGSAPALVQWAWISSLPKRLPARSRHIRRGGRLAWTVT